MKTIRVLLAILIFTGAALGQTCQTNTANLVSQQTSITGSGQCGGGPPNGPNGNVVTVTNTYEDQTVTSPGSDNPGTVVMDVQSTVTGTGQCLIVINPPGGTCFPVMTMRVTNATSTSDYNRFINQAIDQVVTLSGNTYGCANNTTTGSRQDLRQVSGQPCAANGGSGGGSGDDPPSGGCGGSGGSDLLDGSGGTGCSPIIIDIEGEGFHLTSAVSGVMFDISGTGHLVQIAWTDGDYHNGFLALPGPDGLVHNGRQLFGNFTPQSHSSHPNGFLALDEYDKPENGGNGDGVIDEKDAVFSRLRLWIDENHDGICQPNELHSLPELGIYSLALNYFESRRTDDFGNQFRYRAKINPGERRDARDETASGEPGRWAYDVFFVAK